MTLRDVVARLEEFADDETIYAESATPTTRAVVAAEPADGSVPPAATGLRYLLEVGAAREAIDVWRTWRPGQTPTLDQRLAVVTYYAQNDAWLRRIAPSADNGSTTTVGRRTTTLTLQPCERFAEPVALRKR